MVPTRRLVSSGLSLLGVILIAGAALAYVMEDVPYTVPFFLSVGAFICIACGLVLSAIERMRHLRPTDENGRFEENNDDLKNP